VGCGVEVDFVENTFEPRVLVGDFTQVGCELLADLVRELADNRPGRILGIRWL
jgi:hypothetical protein